MSASPMPSKVAVPYAQALHDYAIKNRKLKEITRDFENLKKFLINDNTLCKYFQNPVILKSEKQAILNKTLKRRVGKNTLKFFNFLIERNRINLFEEIVFQYMNCVYATAGIRKFYASTARTLDSNDVKKLVDTLKARENVTEVQIEFSLDDTLIGGLFLRTDSDLVDYTVKGKAKRLAKYLNVNLDV